MKFPIGLWDRLNPRTKKFLTRIRHPLWFGTLRHTSPISSAWGKDRGTPVDRYFIEQFLQQHRQDIHGKVLEVGSRAYTDRFGIDVEHSAVLDNNPANLKATIQTDLESATGIPSDEFDCLIFTQVLQFIYRLHDCVEELRRILKPGGVLLVTVPCVSRIDPSYGIDKDYWRFTASSCEMLFGEVFGKNWVSVRSYGNVLSSIAFLTGVSYQELSPKELDLHDPAYQLLLGVRATKQ